MPTNYKGFEIPDLTDPADITQAFKDFADSLEPTGTIKTFLGSAAPAGWLLCDGSPIPAGTDYDDLRNMVGSNVPDLRGKFLAMAGANGVALKTTGGEATHALTVAEMPGHSHGGTTGNDSPDHAHNSQINITIGSGSGTNPMGVGLANYASGRNSGGATARHKHSVAAEGGGQPHNNMPPFYGVNYIVKV